MFCLWTKIQLKKQPTFLSKVWTLRVSNSKVSTMDAFHHGFQISKKTIFCSFKNIILHRFWWATERATTLLKTDPNVFSCEYCGIFKNIYFKEHLQTAASTELTQSPVLFYKKIVLKHFAIFTGKHITVYLFTFKTGEFISVFRDIKVIVNMSVYIASRTYRFCWQYATILVWKMWSSSLNQLHR